MTARFGSAEANANDIKQKGRQTADLTKRRRNKMEEDYEPTVYATLSDIIEGEFASLYLDNPAEFGITDNEMGEIIERMAREATDYQNTGWAATTGYVLRPEYDQNRDEYDQSVQTRWETLQNSIWDDVVRERESNNK
jgi:hypothetical protein